jgi:hypothetical protein
MTVDTRSRPATRGLPNSNTRASRSRTWPGTDGPSCGLRAVLAHHILFHANRASLPITDQATLAALASRTLAVSLVRYGDPAALLDFSHYGLADEPGHVANLNYWAYWVGEMTAIQRDDSFMPGRLGPWRGDQVLRHLASRLDTPDGVADLGIHPQHAPGRPPLPAQRRSPFHSAPSDQRRSAHGQWQDDITGPPGARSGLLRAPAAHQVRRNPWKTPRSTPPHD